MTTESTTLHFVRTGADRIVISEPVKRMGVGELPYDLALRSASKKSETTGRPVLDLSGRAVAA